MRTVLLALWREKSGQDVIEYTLLVAFVTFAAAAFFVLGAGGHLKGIWESGNNTLAVANTSAS
jgi:Flp pilus assembly pilin Flp